MKVRLVVLIAIIDALIMALLVLYGSRLQGADPDAMLFLLLFYFTVTMAYLGKITAWRMIITECIQEERAEREESKPEREGFPVRTIDPIERKRW
jgi:hypothetical protein